MPTDCSFAFSCIAIWYSYTLFFQPSIPDLHLTTTPDSGPIRDPVSKVSGLLHWVRLALNVSNIHLCSITQCREHSTGAKVVIEVALQLSCGDNDKNYSCDLHIDYDNTFPKGRE